jgi:hypothetical protein
VLGYQASSKAHGRLYEYFTVSPYLSLSIPLAYSLFDPASLPFISLTHFSVWRSPEPIKDASRELLRSRMLL